LNNANFADTAHGLNECLKPAGLQILLGYTNYNIKNEEQLIQQLLQRRPEAIVVTGGRHTARAQRLLENAGIPVVEIWDIPANPIGYAVGFSNSNTMIRMVDHLHHAGARKLAFIGGDDGGDTRGADRRRGFITACQDRGLDYQLISLGTPPVSMREGADAMAKLLASGKPVDAAACVSDLAAFGALTECNRQGLAVPNDFMIAGFGRFDICDVSVPSLTTIDAHSKAIGETTGNLLVSLLRSSDEGKPLPRVSIVEPTLRVSGSTNSTR
jgi:LacI family gluconate utilization system Gnt-I transcriptional repressor